MLVLSYQWKPVSMVLGRVSPFDGLDCGVDALVADTDRVLGDGAGFGAAADGVHLLLARVVADHDQLAGHVQFLHGIQHTDDRAFIGAEVTLQIGVRAE